MKKKVIWILVCLVLVSLVSGCGNDKDIAEQAKNGWIEKTGDDVRDVKAEKYGGGMNESHRMMAAMILSGNGMETDLDKYDSVYLVTIILQSGQEYAMVVADGVNIFPASMTD
jgi:hypothetical protein